MPSKAGILELSAARKQGAKMKSYRMASWWLRPWHLPFNKKVRDDFRRRASDFAQAGADSAIIFGAHFRWDFEHEMDQIHELIAFAAEELVQYKIVLFDHHSTVLTCSCRREISSDRSANFSNHRQVLLSRPAGSRTTDFHDDWKMLNIDDGKPVFLPQYSAEEFCFSNPDFVAAYLNYVRRLLRETGIGGLMSDDAFYYSHRACGCPYCRELFCQELGMSFPASDDLSFWGNYENPKYRRYLDLRRHTVTKFTAKVKSVLPTDFPLMNCCAYCMLPYSSGRGLNYRNFIAGGSNLIMQEMSGNTPDATTGELLSFGYPQQLYHLALSREHRLPCIGLGYGYSSSNAEIIWAFNKFLGSGTWYSSLVQRLGLSDRDLIRIPDDPCQLGHCFQAEKQFPEWFVSESASECAVFYSNATMEQYGDSVTDYADDFCFVIKRCTELGYSPDVLTSIPDPEQSRYKILIVPSAVALSDYELESLERWHCRKPLLLLGPCGFLDETGEPRQTTFAQRHGWQAAFPPLNRTGHPLISPIIIQKLTPAESEAPRVLKEFHLLWLTARVSSEFPNAAQEFIEQFIVPIRADGWLFRKYIDAQGRWLIHGIASQFQVELDHELEKLRDHHTPMFKHLKIIRELHPMAAIPDLRQFTPEAILTPLEKVQVHASCDSIKDCAYFILRLAATSHINTH